MSLFNPDPALPHWQAALPTDADLDAATPEQRQRWLELNAAVSRVHSAWGQLETNFNLLFSSILRMPIAVSQVILSTLNANRTKREVIANCAKLVFVSPTHRKSIDRLMKRTAKIASKRNFLAHGIGCYHQKYPNHITFFGNSADLEPALSHYQAHDLKSLGEIERTIFVIAQDIFEICGKLRRARRRPLLETRELSDGSAMYANQRPPRDEAQERARRPSQAKVGPKNSSPAQQGDQRINKQST